MRNALVLLLLAACSSTTTPPITTPPITTPPASTPPSSTAPWDAQPIDAPAVTIAEWRKAENRATCAPLTFAPGPHLREATPRRANFSGGWAVAYDGAGLPGREPSGHFCPTCGRGAFGIAGTGVELDASDASNVGSAGRMEWPGGNRALYDLEGGNGPGWLAQVHVADQRCLYQVWSFLGRAHIEELIRAIRRARIPE